MTPSTTEHPAWLDANLFPFESHYIEIDGHRVHYVDEGTGPVLLMLHGNPTWSFVYRDVIAELAGRFRCIACDYPGFGLSQAGAGYRYLPEDHAGVVASLVEGLDLEDVTLVAQDWGGPIGLHAALHLRQRFSAMVAANTWAWPVNGDLHFEAFSRLMGGPLGRLAIRQMNLFVNVMIPAGHVRREVSGAEMSHYRRALPTAQRRHASAVLPQQIIAGRRFLSEVDARLDEVADLPTLILWADKDIAFRAKERETWERRMPNHTTAVIEGAGHFVQSDAPYDFARAIGQWHPAFSGRNGR